MYKVPWTGMISAEEQNLRVPKLVHHLLLLQVVTTLSDPRCNLHNAPGTRTVQYGRIKEGDEVEVELCGLYFDAPAPPRSRPFHAWCAGWPGKRILF
jgi:hypothetical protein